MKPIDTKEITKCNEELDDFTTNKSIMSVINLVDNLGELEFHCSVDWSFILFENTNSFLFNLIYQNDELIILRCNHKSTQDRWSNCDIEINVWVLGNGSIYNKDEVVNELKHYFSNWATWNDDFVDGE